jgi:hypothetical protein
MFLGASGTPIATEVRVTMGRKRCADKMSAACEERRANASQRHVSVGVVIFMLRSCKPTTMSPRENKRGRMEEWGRRSTDCMHVLTIHNDLHFHLLDPTQIMGGVKQVEIFTPEPLLLFIRSVRGILLFGRQKLRRSACNVSSLKN